MIQLTFGELVTAGPPTIQLQLWGVTAGGHGDRLAQGLEIPERFVLKTSFPARDLDEMDRTSLRHMGAIEHTS